MSELKNRASGVLMHISSLPGTCGIGTLGKYAYSFIDKLCIAGQSYWQLLPICPTGYGDSPYQSFSTSAGNPYFIDFEELVKAGFLDYSDYELVNWGNDEQKVDYGILYINRKIVFEKKPGSMITRFLWLLKTRTAVLLCQGGKMKFVSEKKGHLRLFLRHMKKKFPTIKCFNICSSLSGIV